MRSKTTGVHQGKFPAPGPPAILGNKPVVSGILLDKIFIMAVPDAVILSGGSSRARDLSDSRSSYIPNLPDSSRPCPNHLAHQTRSIVADNDSRLLRWQTSSANQLRVWVFRLA